MVFFNSDISVISGNSVELPEVCCENAPANSNVSIVAAAMNKNHHDVDLFTLKVM